MKRRSLIVILSLLVAAASFAQKDKSAPTIKTPDLQTTEGAFFDPTRRVKEKPVYNFGVEWRIEVGYVQNNQRTRNKTYPDTYLHGGRIGFAVDFLLPYHFSLQTGVHYSLAAGRTTQHWAIAGSTYQEEYQRHDLLEHNLIIPVRAYYTQKLVKSFRMLFYAGPQLQIGLAQRDKIKNNLDAETQTWIESLGVRTETYDRDKEVLHRVNIQLGVGGGFEYDRYRLTAGYDFGLNNLVRNKQIDTQHMWEWGWHVTFGVRVN